MNRLHKVVVFHPLKCEELDEVLERTRSPTLEIDSWMRRAQAAQTRLQLLLNSGLKPAIEPAPVWRHCPLVRHR